MFVATRGSGVVFLCIVNTFHPIIYSVQMGALKDIMKCKTVSRLDCAGLCNSEGVDLLAAG